MKALENVGIVGDLHCGSRFGLLPPSYWNEHTEENQKWLWKQWRALIKMWPPLDLLVLNGDLIDGTQHRSDGVTLVSTSLGVQTDIAIECLRNLVARAKKVVRTQGTAYHESFHGPLEKLDEVFSIKKPKTQLRCTVRDIPLSGNCTLNVKHKPEGEGTLYRLTSVDREGLWATAAEVVHNLPKADIVVRSHLHSWAHGESMGKDIWGIPGFALQSPYELQKKYYRWQPSIGALLIQHHKLGLNGYVCLPARFPLPPLEVEDYAEI
jgi:hypothetical protein